MINRTIYEASAFVLSSLDYGESDRIVTFFTDRYGKIRGIAKGARRSQKRFANAIELFSYTRILFSRNRRDGLFLIENSDVIDHHPKIRESLEKTMAASYMIELTEQFALEGKSSKKIFCLLQDFFLFLKGERFTEEFLRFFELRLMKLSGYDPILEGCVNCKTPLDKIENPFFSAVDGGIVCKNCNRECAYSIPVSIGTLRTLLAGKEMEMEKIHRLNLSRQSSMESRLILENFIKFILGKELKSLRILREIQQLVV
ncbi:MAG: DNA repair protein RecO [Deltaproteobacteria bacterium]|nr:DNA repair protein RecO [Deltaproteobacteria bacterium]